VTYNGHPLYRFIQDSKPGQANGQGSQAFGAGWYVVAPSGNEIVSGA
jgi:predicted lipoprotein with Yx(FWY)xxD motif